jgi:hypothetical protein
MTAAKLGERGGMRTLALALLIAAPAAMAHADPVAEARSATAACLSAVIDNAPVGDIDGDDVSIRRGQEPVSCTVRVTGGEPVQIRDAVQTAIKRRAELFSPAKTAWEPGDWASRETYCNIPGRRAVAVFVSTAKPGRQPVLTATVFEAKARDQRCDRDLGLQTVADAAAPATLPTAATVPEPATVAAAPEPAKKPGWIRRKLGLGKKD